MVQSKCQKKYHFIGAGGIGMSGLAKLLIRQGHIVTGSDREVTNVVETMRRLGADIRIGHAKDNITLPVDAVVISAAVNESNPELSFARTNDCQVYKYAEMLGKLMDECDGVAVCGCVL